MALPMQIPIWLGLMFIRHQMTVRLSVIMWVMVELPTGMVPVTVSE